MVRNINFSFIASTNSSKLKTLTDGTSLEIIKSIAFSVFLGTTNDRSKIIGIYVYIEVRLRLVKKIYIGPKCTNDEKSTILVESSSNLVKHTSPCADKS